MINRKLLTIWMLSTLPVVVLAEAEGDPQRVAEVEAGIRTEARASWWGFDPEDATEQLQAAINSGAARLIVENMGRPWIVRPLNLAGNQEIIFAEGCEILAKRGAFKGRNDSLVTARDIENVTLRGYGATFRMWRDDYADPNLYEKAEWRHCLSLRGAKNINIYGLTLRESGGDGIYLGVGSNHATNRNIHIRDVDCARNYRQGISVITAVNLLIENTVMRDTAGTAPQAGIDFEPNYAHEKLVNIVMRDCVTKNNAGEGYLFAIFHLDPSSEDVDILIENCKSINDRRAFRVVIDDTLEERVGGNIIVKGFEFENPSREKGFFIESR